MPKIIGVVNTSFEAKDGNKIEGKTVHIVEPIDEKRGVGEAGDRFFLSKGKLSELDFTPAVGQTIEVFYTRYGKVGTLRLIDEEVI